MTRQTQSLLDHFFRYEYGKLISLLINKFNYDHIDLVEDAVQEALLKATRIWPYKTIPDNPFGWLYRVAHNYIIDQLRRQRRITELDDSSNTLENQYYEPNTDQLDDQLPDDLLNMIFACCHPEILLRDRILLSLKLLCGFSIAEIASALLIKEEAVKKALMRAKQKFKSGASLKELSPNELQKRLPDVLKVIYLLFNEGYKATDGDQLIKKDICEDAIRLASIISENGYEKYTTLNALLSLMYFKASRFDARINEAGQLVTLECQDRSRWDEMYLKRAFEYLSASSGGEDFSTYHLEAGIEGHYCSAPSYDETDWAGILYLYDLILRTDYSDMAALNRIVVLEKVKGVNAADHELEVLAQNSKVLDTYLYYAIRAELDQKLGKIHNSERALHEAMKRTTNNVEKTFLKEKMRLLGL